MNDAKLKIEIRLAVPNDATAISMILAEAFAEYEPLYTKEGYAATTPKSDVIKNRFGEGKIWVVILNKKSSARFPLFPKMNLCIFAVWRY